MLTFKCLIGGIYRDIKADQSVIINLPEIRQILKAKENKAKQSMLYFLENQSHFAELLKLNEKERTEKVKELRAEIDEITIVEKERWSIMPTYLKEQEQRADKDAMYYKKKKR